MDVLVDNIHIYYGLSLSDDIPPSVWFSVLPQSPTFGDDHDWYLWYHERITFTDGSFKDLDPVLCATYKMHSKASFIRRVKEFLKELVCHLKGEKK